MHLESINPLISSPDVLSFVLIGAAVLQVFLFLAAAISVFRSERLTRNGRLLWLLVLIAFPFLGAIAWFAWGCSTRLDRGVL